MAGGNSGLLARRKKRELKMLRTEAAPGVSVWLADDSRMDRMEGDLTDANDSPCKGGAVRLDVQILSEYPLKPPSVRSLIKIYHPNIDSEGRIYLNMPRKGSWKPSLNISTLLTSILALMSTPNMDDGLMPEISDLYRRDRAR